MAERVYPPEVPKLSGQKWPDVAPYLEEYLRRLQVSNDENQTSLDGLDAAVEEMGETVPAPKAVILRADSVVGLEPHFARRPPAAHTHRVTDILGLAAALRHRLAHTHRADEIVTLIRAAMVVVTAVDPQAPPAFYDLQDLHDTTRSAGHLAGGGVTDAGGGAVDVAAGSGLIRGLSDDTSTLYVFDWPATAGLAVPADTVRYVVAEYNGGSPQVVLYASESYDYRTAFPLATVVNEGGSLYISETPHSSGRAPGRLIRRNYEVDGRSRAHQLGGLILSESGTKRVAVTAGVTWYRGVRDDFPAFDSNVADTFDRYYRDGGGGWTIESAQVAIPDGLYDDGSGTLQLIGNNNYAVYWLYLGIANGIVMVYGRGDYNSLTDAQMEQPPGDLPLRLQVGSLLLGRYILRRTPGPTFTVVEVDSAFIEMFTVAPVTDHGALAGLGDDDHPQYLLRSQYNPRRWAWMFGGR